MASYPEILAKLTGRMDSVPDDYIIAVNKVEREVMMEILPLLDRLQLDETGSVLANSNNYAIAAKIQEELPKILNRSGMTEAIKAFANGLDEQKVLTESLYETILYGPAFRDLAPAWKQTRALSIDLVGADAVDLYTRQLRNAVNMAIGSRSTYTEVVSTIRTTTTGNREIDGVLSRYAKQQAHDSFSSGARTYAEQINKKYGIEFYRYTGGLKDTSREFCEERKGNYYHKKEIESWANLQWAGKARNTTEATIFTVVGGYSCGHYLAPVPVDKVPVEVLRDAIDKGWVDASELPERVVKKLGLELGLES